MYFSGFAIPPEDGLQVTAAGGLHAVPRRRLTPVITTKKQNSPSRKRKNPDQKDKKLFKAIKAETPKSIPAPEATRRIGKALQPPMPPRRLSPCQEHLAVDV
jgi:hypothetical protein